MPTYPYCGYDDDGFAIRLFRSLTGRYRPHLDALKKEIHRKGVPLLYKYGSTDSYVDTCNAVWRLRNEEGERRSKAAVDRLCAEHNMSVTPRK